MKTLLVIKGSKRADGFTNTILHDALSNVANDEVNTVIFDCFGESFAACDGCGGCKTNGKCVHRELDGFFGSFENADVIVFSTPVYNGTFSAPEKALLDRFQRYFEAYDRVNKKSAVLKRRKAILLCASGRSGEPEFEFIKEQLKRACSVTNLELVGAVLVKNTDTAPSIASASLEFSSILKRSLCDEKKAD